MDNLTINELYDKYKDNNYSKQFYKTKLEDTNNEQSKREINFNNNENTFIIHLSIYHIKNALIRFIKIVVDFLLSRLSLSKVLPNKEVKNLLSIFSKRKIVYVLYFVVCYIIETIINFVYRKANEDKNNINQILSNELLFSCDNIDSIDSYPFISNDDKFLHKETFIEQSSIDLLLIDKNVKFRDQAIKLLKGSIENIFNNEDDQFTKSQDDINKSILELAVTIDNLVIHIFNKKKENKTIDKIFNLSVNLRMLISYLSATSIFRLIKISFHLIDDLNLTNFNDSIIYVAIHSLFANNNLENSEELYKKFIKYLTKNEIIKKHL